MFKNLAKAHIKGGKKYPLIHGTATFKQTKDGVLITVKVHNLPKVSTPCKQGIFAFHLHKGASCTGNANDEFANTLTHFNPNNCKHPNHAGDFPPLFENNGYAYSSFLTDRFKLSDIIGRTVVIHSNRDDFTTDPSGNSGEKIACGKISYIFS